ncbi:MAG: hypothetical protein AAFW69_09550, partial [Pseudomonadota bacterium]
MAIARTLEDFGGWEGLTPAERKWIEELDTGEVCDFSEEHSLLARRDEANEDERALLARLESTPKKDWKPWEVAALDRPVAAASDEVEIRGALIRAVHVAGGIAEGEKLRRLHEKGVMIRGARITGPLDLQGTETERDISLFNCVIEERPNLRGAKTGGLYLNGSRLASGLGAELLVTVRGDVSLREAEVTGEVRLLGAWIGGDLSCTGATLTQVGGYALSCDGMEATGAVFLLRAEATGEVRLLGVRIGADLACNGATLKNPGDDALSGDGMRVTGGVFLRRDGRKNVAIEGA